MDVFTDFEESQKPWSKEKFIEKCQDCYQKMPPGDRSELLKFFTHKWQEKKPVKQLSVEMRAKVKLFHKIISHLFSGRKRE